MKRRAAKQNQVTPDASWSWLYAAGSVLSLLYVAMIAVPLVLIFTTPQPPALGGSAVLNYIASNKAVYVVELICFVGLSVPAIGVFLAVTISLNNTNKSLALLGGLVGIVSEIVALALGSSPQSLSGGLVYLSDLYMRTTIDAQRVALATAAEGFVASANAVSSAGILTAMGILVLSLCMLRGVYHRGVAILGIVAGLIGIAFEALRPQIGALYGIYGLLLPAWFIFVGIRLFKIGFKRTTPDPQ
jgi:hypothetical protein